MCIWFDLLSAAVKVFSKERKLVERFERFALHYGFAHNFCNPDSLHEKEHVENKVGYNRRNLFFDDKLTSAIIDRIVHHSHLLVFTGKSYRLEHSNIKG